MTKQWRAGLIGLILGGALIAGALWNRTPTANNDIFVQLRAGDDLYHGRGLGLLSERQFATRFSPGVSGVAYGLNALGVNPLRALVAIYPVLIALTFGMFVSVLWKVDPLAAVVLAAVSLSTRAFFDAYMELTSEALALPAAAWMFAATVRGICEGGKGGSHYPRLGFAVSFLLASWTLIVVRNAGVLVVAGGVAAWWLATPGCRWRRLPWAVALGLLSLLPLLVFQLAKDAAASSGGLVNGLARNTPRILKQAFSNAGLFPEIILPRVYRVFHWNTLVGVMGLALIALTLFFLWRDSRSDAADERQNRLRAVARAGVLVGLVYAGILSVLAAGLNYDWSAVYRVQAFALPFFGLGFFAALWMVLEQARPRAALAVILGALALVRITHATTAIHMDAKYELLRADYAGLARSFSEDLRALLPGDGAVQVHASGQWQGRNIFHLLKYFDTHDSPLLWPVTLADKPNSQSASVTNATAAQVLLVARADWLRELKSRPPPGMKVAKETSLLTYLLAEKPSLGSP